MVVASPRNVYNEVIGDGNVTPAFSKFIIKGLLAAVAILNSCLCFVFPSKASSKSMIYLHRFH